MWQVAVQVAALRVTSARALTDTPRPALLPACLDRPQDTNYGGPKWVLTSNAADFTTVVTGSPPFSANDQVSSLKICCGTTCPSL